MFRVNANNFILRSINLYLGECNLVEQKPLVKEVLVKEKKTVASLMEELGLNPKFHAVLLNSKRVIDLNEVIDANSKIIVLPKLRGG